MDKIKKRSSLPEDMFQRMEKSMKDSNRVLMVVSPEDIDPALQDPEFMKLIGEAKAQERKWVKLPSGIKVGLPTKEEQKLMEAVRRSLTPNHRLRREIGREKETPEKK